MNIASLFFSLDGRISRMPFWLGIVVLTVIDLALQWFALGFFADPADLRMRIVKEVTELVTLYPSVAIAVKRFHDRNHSGAYAWLIVIMTASTIVIDLLGLDYVSDAGPLFWMFSAVMAVIALALLIELGFRRGTPGDNRFGPDPLARHS